MTDKQLAMTASIAEGIRSARSDIETFGYNFAAAIASQMRDHDQQKFPMSDIAYIAAIDALKPGD